MGIIIGFILMGILVCLVVSANREETPGSMASRRSGERDDAGADHGRRDGAV